MAARAKRPAAAAAARSVGEEGGGWLCRVYGRSPAEGGLAVYALLPRPASPGSLGRLAVVLSGDPRFEAKKAWAWELPRPLAGYAVVELRGGRAHVAIPEEARGALREVGRALEELAARRPAALVDELYECDSHYLLRLRDRLRGWGVTGFTLRALGDHLALELHLPRPMGPEERRRFFEDREGEVGLRPLVRRAEVRLLEGLGLGALAWLAPRRCWMRGGREGDWEECRFLLEIERIYPPLPGELEVEVEGPRGAAYAAGELVCALLRSLDSDSLRYLTEAENAARRLELLLDEEPDEGLPPASPEEVDEAHRRLVAALRGLVGASP
jgi:hypothetical protein